MSLEFWIFVSNVALVIATAAAVWASFREGHRHEEVETAQIAKIAHEMLLAEAQDKATAEAAIAANAR